METKNLTFISDAVELWDENQDDDEVTREVFFDNGIFYAILNDDPDNIRRFRLLKQLDELTDDEKREVLTYCIGHLTGEVYLRDIFLHGKFIQEITKGCPLCGYYDTGFIEDSDEIVECESCGAEWEHSTRHITLDPRDL